MKTAINTLLFILLMQIGITVGICQPESKPKQSKPQFTITNPGQTNVFVKNYGQFDRLLKSTKEKASYVLNGSDQVFFTPNGYTWIIIKPVENDAEVIAIEKKDKENRKTESYFIAMKWEGANPHAQMIAEEEAGGYYTYADEAFKDLKAKGFRKLIYKELYPGIDVEYIIPESKGGIKYSLIVKPGADIKKVKMHYEGDLEKLELDAEGNIIIKTHVGNMIDHAPQSFYFGNNGKVKSNFKLTDNYTVQFIFPQGYNNKTTLVIDPWTIAPNLFGGKGPYDVGYDKYGSVYIDFMDAGGAPQISKYSSAGIFLWTINMATALASTYYSDFCVIPSGSVFIASGFIGSNLCKISSTGILLTTVTWPIALNNEGWVVAYNNCLNTLLIGGGGIEPGNGTCLRMGIDTAMVGTFTGTNFNGATQGQNDMTRMLIDDNGDMYSYFTSSLSATTNKIFKSLPPYTTIAFSNLRTICSFSEVSSIPYSNRLNVMDINNQYLYFFDGQNLEARDKTTGNLLSSILISATYICGSLYQNEGIAVDECNNIYVGGQKMVHVFNFNGSTFTTLPTMAVFGNVYDIMLDKSKQMIYVTGNGFLSSLTALPCTPKPLLITPSNAGSCLGNGTASVIASGGIAPYTYAWSNGVTTDNIIAPPGTYTVTVTDGSCSNPQSTSTTVNIIASSTLTGLFTKGTANCTTGCICKEWIMVTAKGGTSPYTYSWSVIGGYGNRYLNGLCPGNYTINVKDKNGCSVNVNITVP